MATVHLQANHAAFTDGVRELEVHGLTVGAVIDELASRFAGLGPLLREGSSVAINGELQPRAPSTLRSRPTPRSTSSPRSPAAEVCSVRRGLQLVETSPACDQFGSRERRSGSLTQCGGLVVAIPSSE